MEIKILLLTIYFWILSVIGIIITAIVCAISYPFVNKKTFARIFDIVLSTVVLKGMSFPGFWSFKIKGLNKINPYQQYIFVANHGSYVDSLLFMCLPINKNFIMNEKFSKIPIFGWMCIQSGNVTVNHSDKDSTSTTINRTIEAMKDGNSFVIYPEGKRSPNPNKLLEFKSGAFRLAKQINIDIVPVVIKGTYKGLPLGNMCYPADLELIICDPINIDNYNNNITDLKEKTRNIIHSHLNQNEENMLKKLN